MVSIARLEAMNGFHRAAVEERPLPQIALCGCGKPETHVGFCSERSKVRAARQAERDAACTTLCGCGKPTTHLGMCKARWAKRKANFGPSGIKPKTVPAAGFDVGAALTSDRERMLRMAMSWTQYDKAAAEDLVSQAHINILEKIEQFEVGSNFPAWCTTILKNLFLDSKRRAKNTTSIEQENPDGETFEIVDPALMAPPTQESGITAREMARELQEKTTPEQREALLRAAMGGQQYDQIARETGVGEGTVKSRISRARAILAPEARTIPAVSRENADALDFVLQKLREEKERVGAAIVALEQCRAVFARRLT